MRPLPPAQPKIQPLAVWTTTLQKTTARLNEHLASKFGATCKATFVADEYPIIYNGTVVLFFAKDIPPNMQGFRYGASGVCINHVVAIGSDKAEFYSSVGNQELSKHTALNDLLTSALDELTGANEHTVAEVS